MTPDLCEIGRNFEIGGDFVDAAPLGAGHINDTFLVRYVHGGLTTKYTFQRINRAVFGEPAAVMANVWRVAEHLRTKLRAAGEREVKRRTVTVIAARDGKPLHITPAGECWRAYLFIDHARTFDVVTSPAQARAAAKCFGQFQQMLCDLPPPRLCETIPAFHHTPRRYEALDGAVAGDPCVRAGTAKAEIAFAMQHREFAQILVDAHACGDIPERIAHNDTKINNVLFDEITGRALCVIDLDTVMPGLALYDFGDLVRTATSPAPEDERDLARVTMRMEIFEALVGGYLAAAGDVLTQAEKRLLPEAGRLITLETGVRFLTDYLEGDRYFKIARPEHNLDRCRTQFELIRSMDRQRDAMARVAEAHL